MSYEIRLDEFGAIVPRGSSYSTVTIAEEGARSIHWGNASHRSETRSIVTVKLGFLSITVDVSIFGPAGPKQLSALHHRYTFQILDEEQEARRVADTTLANRIDAAHAAILAGDYELACNIEPLALFNLILLTGVNALAGRLTIEHINGIMRAAENESECAFRRGIDAAKDELRNWLRT